MSCGLKNQSFNDPSSYRSSNDVDERFWKSISLSLEARVDATDGEHDIESIAFPRKAIGRAVAKSTGNPVR